MRHNTDLMTFCILKFIFTGRSFLVGKTYQKDVINAIENIGNI